MEHPEQRDRGDFCREAGTDSPLGWTTEGLCGQPPSPRTSRPPQAAAQGENCYENVELSRWPPSGEPAPVQPTQGEVEYSMVVSARAQLP